MPPTWTCSATARATLGAMHIEVVDPVASYARLMQQLFDFERIRALLAKPGFRICFDAMHAITGPYAHEILERQLGAPAGSVINGVPLPDFGGGHPDPNPTYADELIGRMFGCRRAGLRRRQRRRRRPQHDRRPQLHRHAQRQPGGAGGQCPPGARLRRGAEGRGALDAHQRRGRPRGRRRWASPATKRPPAGSSSATCSTPACARCAAKKAPAPDRTMCARRTACGPCCSG